MEKPDCLKRDGTSFLVLLCRIILCIECKDKCFFGGFGANPHAYGLMEVGSTKTFSWPARFEDMMVSKRVPG